MTSRASVPGACSDDRRVANVEGGITAAWLSGESDGPVRSQPET